MRRIGESKSPSYLGSHLLEEDRRVHAIRDGASDEWEPMEYKRGLIGILEKDLPCDIEKDGEDDEGSEADNRLNPGTEI
jgi:hypothetical protein